MFMDAFTVRKYIVIRVFSHQSFFSSIILGYIRINWDPPLLKIRKKGSLTSPPQTSTSPQRDQYCPFRPCRCQGLAHTNMCVEIETWTAWAILTDGHELSGFVD